MFILFDDARLGGASPRLYRQPVGFVVATEFEEILPSLERIRAALRSGKHVAGYLAYEAGHALDPKLGECARRGDGPLLCFGLFDDFETPELSSLLPSSDGAYVGSPKPRMSRPDYVRAAEQVREHLFAGDFYQANLTFGSDVAVAGNPLALYARLRRSSLAGWGGVMVHDGRAVISLSPEQFFTIRGGTVDARPMKGTAPRRPSAALDAAELLK